MDINAKILSNDDELTPEFVGVYGAKFYSDTDPENPGNKVIKILTTNTTHDVNSTTNIEGNPLCPAPTSFVFEMKYYFETVWHYSPKYLRIEFCNKANTRCFALSFRVSDGDPVNAGEHINLTLEENHDFEKVTLNSKRWYTLRFEYYQYIDSKDARLKVFSLENGEYKLLRDLPITAKTDLPSRALLVHSAQKIRGVSYLDDIAFSLTDNSYSPNEKIQEIPDAQKKIFDFEEGIPSEKDFYIDMRLKKFDDFLSMDPAVWNTAPKGGQFKHTHDVYEILLVQSGEARFVTEGEEVPVSEGYIVIVPPRVKHAIVSEKKYNLISISGGFEQLSRFDKHVVIRDNIYGEGKKLAELALYNRFNNEEYFAALCNAYVRFVLLNLDMPKTDMNALVYKMMDKMKKEYGNCEFSVVKLLKESGYAKDYVRTKFFEVAKMTPKKYLTTIRMKKAKELLNLCGEDVSVSRIAEQCGIVDPAVFSKNFKQFYGISPKQYVKKRKEN